MPYSLPSLIMMVGETAPVHMAAFYVVLELMLGWMMAIFQPQIGLGICALQIIFFADIWHTVLGPRIKTGEDPGPKCDCYFSVVYWGIYLPPSPCPWTFSLHLLGIPGQRDLTCPNSLGVWRIGLIPKPYTVWYWSSCVTSWLFENKYDRTFLWFPKQALYSLVIKPVSYLPIPSSKQPLIYLLVTWHFL